MARPWLWSFVLLWGCAWFAPSLATLSPSRPSPLPVPTSTATRAPSPTPSPSPSSQCPNRDRFDAVVSNFQDDTQNLVQQALDVLCALKENDWGRVAQVVHPEQGVRFSPDAYLSDEDPRFTADELPNALDNPVTYVWGTEPGTGRPIALTFAAYVERYVYDAPYWEKARLGVNVRQGAGNIIDNHEEFFPGSQVVEFHIPGSEQYGGLDWRSLRLVFLPDPRAPQGWWLVAIVHDEWSP